MNDSHKQVSPSGDVREISRAVLGSGNLGCASPRMSLGD